jgi:hypothetical protein
MNDIDIDQINGERAADDEPGSRLFDGVTVTFGGTGQGFLCKHHQVAPFCYVTEFYKHPACIFRLFRPDTVRDPGYLIPTDIYWKS